MTLPDLVILAIIVISALFGLYRGLIGTVTSIAAWIIGIWAALHYGAQVGVWLSGILPGLDSPEPTAIDLFGGYALCFIAVMIAVGIVGLIVKWLIKSVGLSGLDRSLGVVIGIARGALIGCVLILLAGFTDFPKSSDWQNSKIVPALKPVADKMTAILPDWAKNLYNQASTSATTDLPLQNLRGILPPNIDEH